MGFHIVRYLAKYFAKMLLLKEGFSRVVRKIEILYNNACKVCLVEFMIYSGFERGMGNAA